MRNASILSRALAVVVLCGVLTDARQGSVPTSYNAITTRTVYQEPALPVLGPAGHHFTDPTFGSRMLRVTDSLTRPGDPGRSFVTGSAAHQLAWNATSDKFWVRGINGVYIPYTFNASTMTAARINPTSMGEGGLTILSQLEPQFSFRSPNLLFGTRQSGTNRPIIRQFNFNTGTYTDILDLGSIATISTNTWARALAGSAAAPEKLSVLFGGPFQQNFDYKVAVFQLGPPVTNVAVLDTQASTITRGATTVSTISLGFYLHHAWIDLSGRYVVLNPVNGSFPESPLPYFIWDLNTDVITKVTRFPGGHDALGYGHHVNQECCTTTSYDGAQWQLRALGTPTGTKDLINPVRSPGVVFMADHTSWNNAQPGTLVPILSSLYRYDSSDTTPWQAWDNEIVAIQTGASSGATVWRFAHHRSNVFADRGSSTNLYFWYLPRAMISPNGRWAMFTSNWEKSLGASIENDLDGLFRNDVFIVALASAGSSLLFTDDPLTVGTSVVRAVHITELRSRIDALRIRFGLMTYPWVDPGLAAGTVIKAVHLTDLRTALQQAYVAGRQSAPAFTDPIVPGSTFIRAEHIQELRSLVINLESS